MTQQHLKTSSNLKKATTVISETTDDGDLQRRSCPNLVPSVVSLSALLCAEVWTNEDVRKIREPARCKHLIGSVQVVSRVGFREAFGDFSPPRVGRRELDALAKTRDVTPGKTCDAEPSR